jgi:hypothetical protein
VLTLCRLGHDKVIGRLIALATEMAPMPLRMLARIFTS